MNKWLEDASLTYLKFGKGCNIATKNYIKLVGMAKAFLTTRTHQSKLTNSGKKIFLIQFGMRA